MISPDAHLWFHSGKPEVRSELGVFLSFCGGQFPKPVPLGPIKLYDERSVDIDMERPGILPHSLVLLTSWACVLHQWNEMVGPPTFYRVLRALVNSVPMIELGLSTRSRNTATYSLCVEWGALCFFLKNDVLSSLSFDSYSPPPTPSFWHLLSNFLRLEPRRTTKKKNQEEQYRIVNQLLITL